MLPSSREQAEEIFPQFLEHLAWFERTVGPYPFRNEKYGIAETPHLGMEHQTIIAYGNQYRGIESGYDWLHHHELAHEWWGNLVTNADWKDMWVHEGIGTYMQALYLEELRGVEGYHEEMARNRTRLNNKRAVAPRTVQDSKQIYFAPDGGHDNDIYSKGSWVMHTLRWTLGDEVFLEALRRMAYPEPERAARTDGGQVRFTDTEEIRALAEAACDCDLASFFEIYLRQPELPVLVAEPGPERLDLSWEWPAGLSLPDGSPVVFEVPVPVRVDGELQRVPMPGGRGQLAVTAGATVEIDPDRWLLRHDPELDADEEQAPADGDHDHGEG